MMIRRPRSSATFDFFPEGRAKERSRDRGKKEGGREEKRQKALFKTALHFSYFYKFQLNVIGFEMHTTKQNIAL